MSKDKETSHYFARIPFDSVEEKQHITQMIDASGLPAGRYMARMLREAYVVWSYGTAKKKMRKREKKETPNGQNT